MRWTGTTMVMSEGGMTSFDADSFDLGRFPEALQQRVEACVDRLEPILRRIDGGA